MRNYIMLSFLILILIQNIISLDTNDTKFIKIPFTDEYSIPKINTSINDIKIETILDNNLNFNYLTTKNFNLTDINFNINSDKIIVNNKIYDAYFYIGDITIFDEKNYLNLNNLNSFVIDDKSLLSSITVSYILQQLKEKAIIDKKIFYLDINNKKCFFGELPKESDEYNQISFYDKYIHSTFYSYDTKGVFKEKLISFYIDNSYYQIDNNITFNINEKYSYIPYSIIEEIIQDKKMSNLNCKLFLIDQKGIYTIKCPKKSISKLPEFFFVFYNYTFTIPFRLLFEDYDENYSISLIRNKIKVQYLESDEQNKEERNVNEWVIGYSIIKYFNYIVFDYEERNVSFYSDYLIRLYPPKNVKTIYKNIFYLLNIVLGFASAFLILIRIKIKSIPLDSKN